MPEFLTAYIPTLSTAAALLRHGCTMVCQRLSVCAMLQQVRGTVTRSRTGLVTHDQYGSVLSACTAETFHRSQSPGPAMSIHICGAADMHALDCEGDVLYVLQEN